MNGLFAPIARRESGGEALYSIALDVAEPYLDDHRPGGQPLFSTVMGIEALVDAARRHDANDVPATLRQVRVFKPYIATSAGPHAVEAAIRRAVAPEQSAAVRFDAVLRSVAADGIVNEHLRAQIEFAAPSTAVAHATRGWTGTRGWTETVAPPVAAQGVGGGDIYRLFFHGPAFRVVDRAQYRNARMYCRLAPDLPPSHRGRSTASEMAPRLIEFALQSAGLLELAVSGRMMIPHSVASIERFLPIDVDHAGAIFATAAFDAQDPAAVTIDVTDELGRTALRVVRYRTEPLPFAVNVIASSRLREQLLGNAGLD